MLKGKGLNLGASLEKLLCLHNEVFQIQMNLRNLMALEGRKNYRVLKLPSFSGASCYSHFNGTVIWFAIRGGFTS